MSKFLFALLFTFPLATSASLLPNAQGQITLLQVDTNQSSVNLTVNGVQRSSTVSGIATIEIQSLNPPSGTAQLTDLVLVAEDGMNFSFLLGLVTASTAPGDISLSMVSPGAPGLIVGDNFDQLDNEFIFGGELNVTDVFGQLIGSQIIDLSTIELPPFDLNSINVVQNSTGLTVTGSFVATQTTDLGPVEVDATFVATGSISTPLLGDVDLNGTVDFGDIPAFISVLQAGEFNAEADIDFSGQVDFEDIPLFIEILLLQ